MFRDGPPANRIIAWSGIIIVVGLVLIFLQLALEAYFIHQRSFGSSARAISASSCS